MPDQNGRDPDQSATGQESSNDERDTAAPDAAKDKGSKVEAVRSANSPMPFDGLVAPTPINASPPPTARWLAFAGILVGGFLGAVIGFGIGDIMSDSDLAAAVGALIGGISCAAGVGIVASLTLRAMNEWNVSNHPEDPRNTGTKSST